jgi:hypothetical protein
LFDLVNSLSCFTGDLLEPFPDEKGAGDMVALDSSLSALALFDAAKLFDLSVQLLDFPSVGARCPYILRRLASPVVCRDVIHLRLAVCIRIKQPPVDGPELIGVGIDVDTSYHTDPPDDAMRIAAALASDRLDLAGISLVQNRVIEHDEPVWTGNNFIFDLFPQQARAQRRLRKITVPHDPHNASACRSSGSTTNTGNSPSCATSYHRYKQ